MQPVVLITGGARGIGRAIATEFARDHQVAVTHHSSPPDALLSEHPDILAISANLADVSTAPAVIDTVMTQFDRVDVIINNAGAIEMDGQRTQENFAVNVSAPAALLDAALPYLKTGAAIINISSVNAVFPAMEAVSYSASKAALNTWTRGMAKTLGPRGIRVNGIAPGAIERAESPRSPDLIRAFVEMTSLGRIGEPEDIAKVARFLASDASGFITGETITVSGGYRL